MWQAFRIAGVVMALGVAGQAVLAQETAKTPPAPGSSSPGATAAPAPASTPVPPWVSLAPARCVMVLRDVRLRWRIAVELMRHRSGSLSVIVRIRDTLLVQPEVGQRVRLSWGTSAFGDRGWTVPIRRVFEPTEGRSLALLMIATASEGLTQMIERAGRSSYLLVGLPGDAPPYRLSSVGFREAWSRLDDCAAPEAPSG
jgi:hypothetical protein